MIQSLGIESSELLAVRAQLQSVQRRLIDETRLPSTIEQQEGVLLGPHGKTVAREATLGGVSLRSSPHRSRNTPS